MTSCCRPSLATATPVDAVWFIKLTNVPAEISQHARVAAMVSFGAWSAAPRHTPLLRLCPRPKFLQKPCRLRRWLFS